MWFQDKIYFNTRSITWQKFVKCRSSGAKGFLFRILLNFFIMLQKGLFKMLLCPRHRSGILIYHIITPLVIVHSIAQMRCIWFFICLPFTNITSINQSSSVERSVRFASFPPSFLPYFPFLWWHSLCSWKVIPSCVALVWLIMDDSTISLWFLKTEKLISQGIRLNKMKFCLTLIWSFMLWLMDLVTYILV